MHRFSPLNQNILDVLHIVLIKCLQSPANCMRITLEKIVELISKCENNSGQVRLSLSYFFINKPKMA